MKRIFTLLLFVVVTGKRSSSQVILNELYTDPGAGKHEFFELYNNSVSAVPFSVNDITLITYFNISGTKGFYVMDLPDLSVPNRGYLVGSSASPFNYQGTSNSTATDFSWNSALFTSNQGSLKKWVLGTANLVDGNPNYDQAALPANFNDFFYRITGTGASYSAFLYYKGQLLNVFIGGTGGMTTVTSEITAMPTLFVDMAGSSPDFTLNFSGYGTVPTEYCTNDAGSDNGYIREFDGACGSWKKSSSTVTHTPKATNGSFAGASYGSVSVSVATWMGNASTGSILNNDVVSAPANYFPIQLEIYTDLGTTNGKLDAGDVYVTTNTENVLSDGPFYTKFFPYDAQLIVAVKTNAGCYDKILYVPNVIVLSCKLSGFSAATNERNTSFSWSILENENLDRCELQQSTDGRTFSNTAIVFGTDKSGAEAYTYNTEKESTETFYRLKMVSKSGKVDYSSTIRISPAANAADALKLLSNPVRDEIKFQVQGSGGQGQLLLADMNGRVIMQKQIGLVKGNNIVSLPFPSGYSGGTYILTLQQEGKTQSTRLVH